jgi:cephalosporin-C deacetylase
MGQAAMEDYRGRTVCPADFDEFWDLTLTESRAQDGAAVTRRPAPTALRAIECHDLTFPGFAGEPVKAWLRLPAGLTGPAPAVVQFQGYGGGRAHPLENLPWAAAGYVHLVMDTRGQGSSWSAGSTPDPHGAGPQAPGVMTKGIESPETYYYRRLMTDAVRAVEAVSRLDEVDAARVAVVGASQGGALALAAAALAPEVAAAAIRVPFLCDYRRAVEATDVNPFAELTRYLAVHRASADRVFAVLSYFDAVNFARRAAAPSHWTVALMDAVVPPSTVYAAYNNYTGPKAITVWPFNGHESGGPLDDALALDFFAQALA